MKHSRSIFFALVLLSFGCENPYPEPVVEAEKEKPILIKGVSIFNGKDSVLLSGQDVFINNGIIQEIGSSLNHDGLIVDGAGLTLMPGLIDAHVHLTGSGAVPWDNIKANEEYNLSAYLYAGVTTVYDLGGMGSALEKLANKVENGEVLGPSIYHTHIPITTTDSHPIPLSKEILPWPLSALVTTISPIIEKPSEASDLLENYVKKEVDYVKIICDQIPAGSPEMSLELMQALIQESHRLGYKVVAHIGSPQNALDALRAGADVLAHGIWRGELTPEQADQVASYGKPIIYTAAAFKNVSEIKKGEYSPGPMDTLLVPNRILEPVTRENGKDVENQQVMNAFFKDVWTRRSSLATNFEMLIERNVPIIIGTDSSLPGTYAGSTIHQELQTLAELGLSNYDVLKGATYLSAQLFEDQPGFGIVAKGQQADLLLVKGNPLDDLKTLQSPVMILSKGRVVSRVLN